MSHSRILSSFTSIPAMLDHLSCRTRIKSLHYSLSRPLWNVLVHFLCSCNASLVKLPSQLSPATLHQRTTTHCRRTSRRRYNHVNICIVQAAILTTAPPSRRMRTAYRAPPNGDEVWKVTRQEVKGRRRVRNVEEQRRALCFLKRAHQRAVRLEFWSCQLEGRGGLHKQAAASGRAAVRSR